MKPYGTRNIRRPCALSPSGAEGNNTFSLRQTIHTLLLSALSRTRPGISIQQISRYQRATKKHRHHALLRSCHPHLHPHRTLLSLRPGLPPLAAYRFREMGTKEEVPIRSDLLTLHAYAHREICLQYAPPDPLQQATRPSTNHLYRLHPLSSRLHARNCSRTLPPRPRHDHCAPLILLLGRRRFARKLHTKSGRHHLADRCQSD